MTDTEQHQPLAQHPHAHGVGCGHATVRHGDHLDYLHDGEAHHVHGDHVDDEGLTPGDVHAAHAGHMHVHRHGCGHEAIRHEDHLDYLHGGHRHTGHQVHYDEH